MIFSDVRIVGSYYRGADVQALVATLDAGAELRLEREPENEHDNYAIKAFYEDVHIGYVSRQTAGWIASKLDEGYVATCTITEMGRNGKGNPEPIAQVELTNE